jgi:seryl-tRNA synthetase
MLVLNVLRNNTAEVKRRLAIKQFKQPELVDRIIALDDDRKKLQAEFDGTQAKVNAASKEIGKLMGQGKKEEAETQKGLVAEWKAALEPLKENMSRVEKELQDALVVLPNLPADKVPEGKTPEENIVVREGGVNQACMQALCRTGT